MTSQIFFVLSQKNLTVYTGKTDVAPFVFRSDVLAHQEIKDKNVFERLLKEYFVQFKGLKADLFLANEVVFYKKIVLGKDTVLDTELKSFLDSVPFPQDVIEKKMIDDKTSATFFATNADIYKTIIAVSDSENVKIRHVIPILLFENIFKSHPVSFVTFSHIAKQKQLLKQGDFLNIEEEKEETGSSTKQLIVLGISLLFFIGAIILLLINLGIISYRAGKKNVIKTPTVRVVSPTVRSQTPVSSVSAKSQKQLPIQVLNASGIVGESKLVGDRLIQIGYTNTTIGNSNSSISGTLVQFSSSVSAQTKTDIIGVLNSLFTRVVTDSSEPSGSFPVGITIGQQ